MACSDCFLILPRLMHRREEVKGRYNVQVKGPRVNVMINVHPEELVSDLKQIIKERTAIPCVMQRLVFQRKTMNVSDMCKKVGRDGRN